MSDADRRRHQPARVEQADDVAVLLDAVLVAHRPAHARGREPVDLPHVVVGEVVAHRLEVGAESERPARAATGLAEPAAAQRDHEPARGGEVRVGDQLARAPSPANVHAASPSGPVRRAAAGGQLVRAAATRDEGRVERAVRALAGSTTMSGALAWRMRTRPRSSPTARTVIVDATPRATTWGAVRCSSSGRLAARASTTTSTKQDHEQDDADLDRHEEREQRDADERECRTRSRAHRGIGTMPIAVRTASSAV